MTREASQESSRRRRGEARRQRIVIRKGIMARDAEAFDREFWAGVSPDVRMEVMWDLVLDYLASRGFHGEPRLRRSVCRVQRRQS